MERIRKFVIQKHTSTGEVHWDLMLEAAGVLETYRLSLPPEQLQSHSTTAVKIFDHPLKFLTYEGSVNKGKGSVKIAEAGTYQITSQTEDKMELYFEGRILNDKFTLSRLDAYNWKFEKGKTF